jgi:hypothetical protein
VSAVVGTSQLLGAILLQAHGTFLTITLAALSGITLGTDTNPITDFDAVGHLGSHTNCCADNLVTNTAWVESGSLWLKRLETPCRKKANRI